MIHLLLYVSVLLGGVANAADTVSAAPAPVAGSYTAAPESKFGFAVRNFLVSTVDGQFSKFNCDIQIEQELQKSSAKCEIDVESISTGNPKRDEHLRTADFFAVKEYPKMQFVSDSVSGTWQEFELKGVLTIRGTSKPVTFKGRFEPDSSHFTAESTINRQDFGVKSGGSISNSVLLKLTVKLNPK